MSCCDPQLHRDLRDYTARCIDEIGGPTATRASVIDSLLDIRNLGNGRDLGLELTVDEMLERMPAGANVSSEWWLDCLNGLVDHATFLAAGYPPAVPALSA